MKRERSHSPGIAVLPLIFGVMVLGILGLAISWEVYNTQVSSVDVVEMQQAYALAQSGIDFAIGYANDITNNHDRHMALKSPGVTRIFPPIGSFPGGSFAVVYNSGTNVLKSTGTLKGSTARRELALMNFRDYVTPDWSDDFDEPSQSFDERYFPISGPLPLLGIPELENPVVLTSIDDRSDWLSELIEQAFSMAGEEDEDPGSLSSFLNIGNPFVPFGEFIIIMPTTPGTGLLTIEGLERTAMPVELDAQGYQNYSIEVKFKLNVLFPSADQGFGIIFRLHHPTKPLGGPWNNTDLEETLMYVLQMEPFISRHPVGGFFLRWWATDLTGHSSEIGSCGGAGLFFNEDYCKEKEPIPAGFVDVHKGGYFFPEHTDFAACNPSSPNNPGWGWRDNGLGDNAWIDCNNNNFLDVHKLRVDVLQDKFTVYFGTEHGIHCDDTDSFIMHKIMEIDVEEERTRRGNCVPDYKAGHIGLRVWNGFQAQIDYIKVWAM